MWNQVTPGNKLWIDTTIQHPPRSLEKAAALFRSAGFTRRRDGILVDAHGEPVEFTILTNPSNAQRSKIAAIIQDDVTRPGMQVRVVPLEFQTSLGGIKPSVMRNYLIWDAEQIVWKKKNGEQAVDGPPGR